MSAPTVLHHVVEGPPRAPAVVLSNSLGTSLGMWDAQVPTLTRTFRVVRYDHRGHGESPVPRGPYDIAGLGTDLVKLLDHLRIDRAHLCGLSLGGMVSMWVAINAPDRVDRLALCCTSAKLGPPERWAKRAALVRRRGTEAVADAVVGRWFTPAFARRRPEEVARLRAMLAATSARGYAACCGAIERMDLEPHLRTIRADTLVVVADADLSIPPEHGERIAQAIPNARLASLHGAHLVNVERPKEVTALLVDHLAAAERRPRQRFGIPT